MYLLNINLNSTQKKMKLKILKHCDWHYKDMAVNHTNVTRVELIDQNTITHHMLMYLVKIQLIR